MLDKFLVGHFIKIITMKVKDKPTFSESARYNTDKIYPSFYQGLSMGSNPVKKAMNHSSDLS